MICTGGPQPVGKLWNVRGIPQCTGKIALECFSLRNRGHVYFLGSLEMRVGFLFVCVFPPSVQPAKKENKSRKSKHDEVKNLE